MIDIYARDSAKMMCYKYSTTDGIIATAITSPNYEESCVFNLFYELINSFKQTYENQYDLWSINKDVNEKIDKY